MDYKKRKEIAEWHKKNDSIVEDYLGRINCLIEKSTKESYIEIARLFEEEINIDDLKKNSEMSYIIVAVNILYRELEANTATTIFDKGNSVADIIACINQLRFLLFEIELANINDSVKVLMNFVSEYDISVYALIEVISNSTKNPYGMFMLLADCYHGKKPMYEYRFLMKAIERRPNDENATEKICVLYESLGKAELAKELRESFKRHETNEYINIDTLSKEKDDAEYKLNKSLEKKYKNVDIAFIMCANDEQYMQEAIFFINNLIVPEGVSIDIFTVGDAKSMTSGYNEAMKASNSKYKIYLHQDVFIINPYFLYYILNCFEDERIGMIGMVGSPTLPKSNIMWDGNRKGQIYCADAYNFYDWNLGTVEGQYCEVEAIDGMLIATQYDIPWREDIFDKWDMYDISQSFEMRKAGYKIVVPYTEKPLTLHDDGFMNLRYYYEELEKFEKEYNREDM